ncbi:MAG: LytR/AlgR family response regulator transcription factor [Chitinophagaceae bacterium]
MNHITTLLVDDEPRGLTSLQKLLQLNCPDVEVVGHGSSAEEAKEKINQLHPQLVFLDIAMPGKTGFDLLRDIGAINFEIIFITAYNNYMTQAFHFSAVDYLLKPVDEELLIQAVKRAGKKIVEKTGGQHIETLLHNIRHKSSSQKMKLCIPSVKGFQVVDIMDIIYCEANSNYTNFYFVNHTTVCASKPIHEYEELLEDCSFVRIHKSMLINLEHVKEYVRGEGGSVILSDGQELEVSRRKKDLLMTKMKEFFKY